MNRNVLLAFIVWAIDIDGLSLPFTKAWEMFQRDAWGIYRNYTDPNDKILYIPSLVGQNPLEVFTDYILCYAKMQVISNVKSYGKYNELIKNYHG